MSVLNRFYQWITTSPNLFLQAPPFCDLSSLNSVPLAPNTDYQGNSRLGFLYQYLCRQAFENSAHYQVIEEEIQLSDQGRTLGAIDFIICNQQSRKYEHWEVAIKFYLLHQGIWYGPNAHDQLDKKLTRMLHHQLAMSQSSAFLNRYPTLNIQSQHLLLQGRLYTNPFNHEAIPSHCEGYPLNPSQISGHWCYYSQSQQISQPLYALPKPHWAIGKTAEAAIITPNPQRFIHGQTADGQFWFVVPDTWPLS